MVVLSNMLTTTAAISCIIVDKGHEQTVVNIKALAYLKVAWLSGHEAI